MTCSEPSASTERHIAVELIIRRERRIRQQALANDVERFLAHEPVTAGPPGAGYRVRKFVRRHRVQVAAASLVLLALVGGVIGTTVGLVEAKRRKDIAESRRLEAENTLDIPNSSG